MTATSWCVRPPPKPVRHREVQPAKKNSAASQQRMCHPRRTVALDGSATTWCVSPPPKPARQCSTAGQQRMGQNHSVQANRSTSRLTLASYGSATSWCVSPPPQPMNRKARVVWASRPPTLALQPHHCCHSPAPSPCSCTIAFSSRRFMVISS
jgi:hypothetical protein